MRTTINVGKWIDNTLEDGGKINRIYRKLALDMMSRIVLRTPVDTGRARGAWTCALNRDPSSKADRIDKGGGAAMRDIKGAVNMASLSDEIVLFNNVEYIGALENGGLRGNGPRTVNGYSIQAPQGMVSVTIADFEYYFRKAARATR